VHFAEAITFFFIQKFVIGVSVVVFVSFVWCFCVVVAVVVVVVFVVVGGGVGGGVGVVVVLFIFCNVVQYWLLLLYILIDWMVYNINVGLYLVLASTGI